MRLRATIVCLSLLASIAPSISATPPKAGVTCAKAGLIQNYNGKKYTCVKSGKKLVWDAGVVIKQAAPKPSTSPTVNPTPSPSPVVMPSPSLSPSPTPSPSPSTSSSTSPTPSPNPSPTQSSGTSTDVLSNRKQPSTVFAYAPPSLPSENIDLCKIKETREDATRSGFPRPTPAYKDFGEVKWALIPLDWADVPGEANFIDRAKENMQGATEWADLTSEGQFKIEWQMYDKWVRLPGSSSEYAIPPESNGGFNAPDQQRFWQRAIVEADKYFDFTGIQAVMFILPAGQQVVKYGIKGNNWFDVVKNYTTGEGTKIDFFAIPSTFNEEPNSGRNYWSWWMYHFMVGVGVAKYGGSKIALPLTSYLLQGSTEGSREIGGWIRFLIGWMPENRVYCRLASNLSPMEITLVPLTDNKTSGLKLAVIPLSETKAIILESRRETKYSCLTQTVRNGVFAYLYDSSLGHEEEYFKAIAPEGRPNESYSCYASPSPDFLLHQGDKVTYGGVTIELLAHGDFDRVKLTRNA